MKFFRTKSEMAEVKNSQELQQGIQAIEKKLGELRHLIVQRRTMLKNADKKLQQFQDTIYAMLIEDEYSSGRRYRTQKDDTESSGE